MGSPHYVQSHLTPLDCVTHSGIKPYPLCAALIRHRVPVAWVAWLDLSSHNSRLCMLRHVLSRYEKELVARTGAAHTVPLPVHCNTGFMIPGAMIGPAEMTDQSSLRHIHTHTPTGHQPDYTSFFAYARDLLFTVLPVYARNQKWVKFGGL